MKDMMKKVWDEYGWLLVVTSAVILLQTVVGVVLWDRLPDTIVTHFDVNGEPNGYSSKTFTVFGMPLLMLALQAACLLMTCSNNHKLSSTDPRIRRLSIYIIPAISLLVSTMTYGHALGTELNVRRASLVFIGVLVCVLGNYMPKIRHNYTTGIKLPWTLADEEVWDKTHRISGPVWMIGGLLLLVCGVMDTGFLLPGLVLFNLIAIPTVYSLSAYMKKYKDK